MECILEDALWWSSTIPGRDSRPPLPTMPVPRPSITIGESDQLAGVRPVR